MILFFGEKEKDERGEKFLLWSSLLVPMYFNNAEFIFCHEYCTLDRNNMALFIDP